MTPTDINNMLTRKGVTATVQVYASASFDPDTNSTTRGSVTEYTVKAIPPYRNREGYRGAELITSGRGLSGIANLSLSFTVKPGIVLVIAGKSWTVTGVQEVKNNTGVLLYLLEIESGS